MQRFLPTQQCKVVVTLPGATHLVYDLSRSCLGFRHIHKHWWLLGFEQAKSLHIASNDAFLVQIFSSLAVGIRDLFLINLRKARISRLTVSRVWCL